MRIALKVMISLALCLMLLLSGVSSHANSELEYTISSYDVNVRINPNGSLDITESVKYTSFGGYNNTVLLIDKREGEEIEIKNVYMLQKEGYIECDMLSAGQWDANVFMGSYSVIQEKELVRVKVYGTFSKRYGSIIIKYTVKNAIKRYGDVAEYRRNHIQKNWEGRISNINITVTLPLATDTGTIRPFLHGVLVGRKKVESKRSVSFNVPDTVPGEYVEAGIIFPEYVMYSSKVTDHGNFLNTILEEEEAYNESDKADLLRARENAAREAGRRAWNERMRQRTRDIASVFSILASLSGLYILYRIQKKLHQINKAPIPMDIKGIERLRPSEVRLLMANGKTGARAFLGSLLYLCYLGFLKSGIVRRKNTKKILSFSMGVNQIPDILSEAEKYLLGWVAGMLDENGEFNPENMILYANRLESASSLKLLYDKWENRIYVDYAEKNKLDTGILFHRNLGLVIGSILFFLGCLVPVSLSIWAGYSMLPVGLILFLYTLRIGKHTDYTIAHHRLWKELRKRMANRAITLDSLPVWMNDSVALLSYSVVMGTEEELSLVAASLDKKESALSGIIDKDINELEDLIKDTLAVLDKALSSVQDI